jgi:hypothetical protein
MKVTVKPVSDWGETHILRTQIIARLAENHIPYTELRLNRQATILISQHGGRIFGPFLSAEGNSLFWVNPAFKDRSAFQSLIMEGWNLGGERLWVAPEIQYMVRDRAEADHSWFCPRQMDPGNWVLDTSAGCRLYQEMTLQAYNLAVGAKILTLETCIAAAADPLRHLDNYSALIDGVEYAGYEQVVTFSEDHRDEILSGAWNLIQLNSGGGLFIPGVPENKPTLYKGKSLKSTLTLHPHFVELQITGDLLYKVGFKAAHTFGRIGYLSPLSIPGDERAYLLIRSFTNQPSSIYPEEPAGAPDRRGDSIHVYNHSGAPDSIPAQVEALAGRAGFKFGEMECAGRTIGGETGISRATDTFSLYLYIGAVERLRPIAHHLLGIDLV